MAYYSRSGQNYVGENIKNLSVGNTEVVAKIIGELTGCDEFRIETEKSYPEDYTETTLVAQDELRKKTRPPLTAQVTGMEGYDVIILCYPNWWGTMPMAVFTFLESYDFAGKTILPLGTHEGSGLGRSESDIRQVCPQAKVLKGLAVKGSGVKGAGAALKVWLKDSQIIE